MKNYIYANNNKRRIIISNRKENINNKTINKNNNIFKIGKTNHFNSVGLPPILNRKIIHRKININNNNNQTYLDPISKIINYSNNRNNNNDKKLKTSDEFWKKNLNTFYENFNNNNIYYNINKEDVKREVENEENKLKKEKLEKLNSNLNNNNLKKNNKEFFNKKDFIRKNNRKNNSYKKNTYYTSNQETKTRNKENKFTLDNLKDNNNPYSINWCNNLLKKNFGQELNVIGTINGAPKIGIKNSKSFSNFKDFKSYSNSVTKRDFYKTLQKTYSKQFFWNKNIKEEKREKSGNIIKKYPSIYKYFKSNFN